MNNNNHLQLIDYNKPVLLLSPFADSNVITNQMLALVAELSVGLDTIDAESASASTVKRVVKLCQRGINRLMALAGSVQVVSNDSRNAEKLVNAAIARLAEKLNTFVLELRNRSAESDEALLDYLETLDGLVGMLVNWQTTAEPPSEAGVVDKELEQYL